MRVLLAYIDPAAGATLMQLVLAGTVGVGALVKLKWRSIKSVLGRSKGPEPGESRSQTSSDEEFIS